MLIVNADDWGRSAAETDSALQCFRAGRLTSVSAMMFMNDSARAAEIALDAGIPVGLHFNVCESFSGRDVPERIVHEQEEVVRFFGAGKYATLVYHPGLRHAFAATWTAQAAEFSRLYGQPPTHVDGHRHKHLSMNVLLGGLIPSGQRVRRGFFFWPGEKGVIKRAYRRLLDRWLLARYRSTDYFFSLAQCLEGPRLERVLDLARSANVEIMAHPVKAAERDMLLGSDFGARTVGLPMGSYRDI